ncbi:MAG: SDR family oxidoreductase [Desulfomonilia bacterium]
MEGSPGTGPGTAVVTGGARGIGKAIARRLLDEGFRVAILDIDRAAGAAAADELRSGSGPLFLEVDVGDETSVRKGFEELLARGYAPLDAVINNAGISDPSRGPIQDFDLAYWNRVLAVNLTSVMLTTRYAYPLFREGKGAIVNIASTRFLQSEKNTFAYTASKGGMVSLTHCLAISLGPGIRVNCISPGWINSRGEPLTAQDHAQHPAGRVGEPRDIASLVSWLISDEAGFVTGQNFIVDGGMTRRMIYVE